MRVVVSPYWSIAIKTLLGIDIFVALFVFFILVNDYTYEGLLILGGFSLLCILITVLIFFIVRRLLTIVYVAEQSFQSVLLNKKLCYVDTNKRVYYMVFRCAESVYSSQEFILISNYFFEYKTEEKIFSGNIVYSYDINKQILLPYNDKTYNLIDIRNWKNVKEHRGRLA